MKTLVHIGSHKTATTSIQSFLQDHIEDLLRYGYYFPTSLAGISASSHWPLSIYALREKRLSPMKELILADYGSEYLANLIREVESDVKTHYSAAKKYNCHTVIWSALGYEIVVVFLKLPSVCHAIKRVRARVAQGGMISQSQS
jgi:hypothetical protein